MRIFRLGKIIDSIFLKNISAKNQRKKSTQKINHILEKGADPLISHTTDFEKAFDTIEWSFIQKVLKRFNFGQVIRRWISVLYSDVESAVLNGRYSTNYFKIARGVRQGCPLSPLLFVLITCRCNGSKRKAVLEVPRNKITEIRGGQN